MDSEPEMLSQVRKVLGAFGVLRQTGSKLLILVTVHPLDCIIMWAGQYNHTDRKQPRASDIVCLNNKFLVVFIFLYLWYVIDMSEQG